MQEPLCGVRAAAEFGGRVRADGGEVFGVAGAVCLTPRGRAALRAMRASARATEEAWRQQLGDSRLAEFRAILLDLLTATE